MQTCFLWYFICCVLCVDIDECTTGSLCPAESQCINTEPGYACQPYIDSGLVPDIPPLEGGVLQFTVHGIHMQPLHYDMFCNGVVL